MDEGPVEQNAQDLKHRGKLYVLSEDAWEDKGTALVSVLAPAQRLLVRDEASNAILYDHRRALAPDCYRLQGDAVKSIVVWEDEETHYALSFQDADSAAQIFAELCGEKAKRLLPPPETQNLEELARCLSFVPPAYRQQLACECMDPQFITALRQAFHTAEDAGAEQELVWLWFIAKGVFLLANQRVTQRYLRHDIYEDVMGMLEYDDGIPAEKRICHRQMLKVAVRFKEVLAFQDAEMLELIHLNYRLQYLKDHVLPRVLDDASFASLSQLVIMHNTVLLNHLQKSEPLMKQLFDGLRQKDLQSLLFLQDACRLAKAMPPGERKQLYEKMVKQGLFTVLLPFLSWEDTSPGTPAEGPLPRHMAMEVLVQSTLSDAGHLRRYLLTGKEEQLLDALILALFRDSDHGVQSQVADVLQLVMDTTQLNLKASEILLKALYDKQLVKRIAWPLIQNAKGDNPRLRLLSQSEAYAIQVVCELLAFAVANHSWYPCQLIMEHNVAYKAAALALAAPHRHLQLAPVRLVKAMVKAQDHMYLYDMLDSGVFELLLNFLERSTRPPLLGGGVFVSAMADLLELIRMQNAKPLVTGLFRLYRGSLEALAPNVKSVAALLARHAQNEEEQAQREARQQKKSSLRRTHQFTDVPAEGAADEASVGLPLANSERANAGSVEEVDSIQEDDLFNEQELAPFSSDSSDDSDDSDSSDSSNISEEDDSDYEQPEGEEEESSSDDDDPEEALQAQAVDCLPSDSAAPAKSDSRDAALCEDGSQSFGEAAGGATTNEASLDNCTIEELKDMISKEIMEAAPRKGGVESQSQAKVAPPTRLRKSGTPQSARAQKSLSRYRRFLAGAAATAPETSQQAAGPLSHTPKRARMETPAPVPA